MRLGRGDREGADADDCLDLALWNNFKLGRLFLVAIDERAGCRMVEVEVPDRKSTRLNSSHL